MDEFFHILQHFSRHVSYAFIWRSAFVQNVTDIYSTHNNHILHKLMMSVHLVLLDIVNEALCLRGSVNSAPPSIKQLLWQN